MNHVTVAGHLGADPEVRFTSSGQKVTTLRLAARVRRGQKDETIWWKITIWGEGFDKMLGYLKKGSGLIVMGDLNKPEIFTDKEGRPQVSMSMTAFNISFSPFGKPEHSQGSSGEDHSHSSDHPPTQGRAEPAMATSHGRGEPMGFSEDEIPF